MDQGASYRFPENHRKDRNFEVAYFAAEFALTDSLPIYAGGLGAVACEFLKSASALGVHLVGIGLLYRESSHQWLDESGFQQESWDVLAFDRLPVEPAQDAAGHPVRVRVRLPGRGRGRPGMDRPSRHATGSTCSTPTSDRTAVATVTYPLGSTGGDQENVYPAGAGSRDRGGAGARGALATSPK